MMVTFEPEILTSLFGHAPAVQTETVGWKAIILTGFSNELDVEC